MVADPMTNGADHVTNVADPMTNGADPVTDMEDRTSAGVVCTTAV
jgi:hypothetical protein